MKLSVKTGAVEQVKTGALAVTLFEDGMGRQAARVDKAMKGAVLRLVKRGDFTPKPGNTAVLYPEGAIAAERLVLVGLGAKKDLSADRLRLAAAKAAVAARGAGSGDGVFAAEIAQLDPAAAGQAVAEGGVLGLYRYQRYKTADENNGRKALASFTVLADTPASSAKLLTGVRLGEIIAGTTAVVRDMVSAPAADMTPSHVAAIARGLGRKHRLRVQVLERAAMKRLGMGALLGVASGSVQPPRFIIVEYRGGGKGPWIALVGKTITFDSGGISIKPSEGMDKMKSDMAGGAAVLGAVANAAALKLPLNVVALLPATENMPGGSAYKPGDILRTMSGQTIEVLNTDAEGRLILADALTYACRYDPAAIVDVATLTGACRIALGPEAAGMLGTDEKLKQLVRAAGEATGERVWEMPLWDGYCDLIKSDIADMKNTGGRDGGVITAACLLRKFVGKHPWVHLDIAATAWIDKDRPYTPKGATGFGCRLLTQFLRDYPNGRGKEGKEERR
jgi:leucyl aminopeptidase